MIAQVVQKNINVQSAIDICTDCPVRIVLIVPHLLSLVQTPPAVASKESPPLKPRSSPTLLERLGSLRKSKKALVEDESKLQSFVVQYLGCQGVSRTEGLDAVRVPLQQMAQPKNPSYSSNPFLVDFDVTPEGIFMTDPQKKVLNRKCFPVKNITYIVRIR